MSKSALLRNTPTVPPPSFAVGIVFNRYTISTAQWAMPPFIHRRCNGSPSGGSSTPHRGSLELCKSVPTVTRAPLLPSPSTVPIQGKSWLFQALFHLRTFNATDFFLLSPQSSLWALQAVPSNSLVLAVSLSSLFQMISNHLNNHFNANEHLII